MIYTIVCKWKVRGEFQIEASSLKEAKEKCFDLDCAESKSEYVDDSFVVDDDATGEGNPQFGLDHKF